MIIRLLTIFMLGWYCNVSAQNSDSLKSLDFTDLLLRIENSKYKKDLLNLYLKTFLDRAKSESDFEKIIRGYRNYIYYGDDQLSVVYADSMVKASFKTNDNAIIGSAYLTKGIVHYSLDEYREALDYYLIAQEYILKTKDEYLKYKAVYNIAHLKYYLGRYDEALVLFQDCLGYFEVNNPRAYLNTLHSIAICLNRMGNYGYSSEIIQKGIEEGKRLSDLSMEPYFIHQEGINHYFRANCKLAIDNLNKVLPAIQENQDFANVMVGHFYIGKSYLGLKNVDKAKEYFEKVEQDFDERKYIRPDLRESFEFFIKHYEEENNLTLKLHYIEKLLQVDSVLNVNYRYLTEKIHKEFDTKALERNRDEIIKQLEWKRKQSKFLIFGVILLIVALLWMYYRFRKNKKLYKLRFEELMNRNHAETKVTTEMKSSRKSDLNPEITQQLLKQLEKFEHQKKFLEKDLTLVKMAASFNSNTKYLRKIIFYNRDKGFVDYINDLKIDYIVELLKEDKKYRNYTNKALAEEAGFSSTQRFVNAFVSRTGISPTYFIQELMKLNS